MQIRMHLCAAKSYQASMSLSLAGEAGDFNCDETVGMRDLLMLGDRWLADAALLAEDMNRDGLVSFPDFAEFADSWLAGVAP